MKNPDALEWYRFANMDLKAAKTLDEHSYPNPSEIICYHCQQAAEKMLKGFLIQNNQNAPKTHDLILLCNLCVKFDESLKTIYDYCEYLDNFSVLPRYPNELEIIETDAKNALKYAEQIIEFFTEYDKIELLNINEYRNKTGEMTQQIKFRKMNEDEYNQWIEWSVSDYTKSLITSGQYPETEARQQAEKEFCSYLTNGLYTENHNLLIAENIDGEPVGAIWYETQDPSRAFIADFVVYEKYRQMGYGTAILAELERILILSKTPAILLHVFEYNIPAIKLYEKFGFVIKDSDNDGSIYMEKVLQQTK